MRSLKRCGHCGQRRFCNPDIGGWICDPCRWRVEAGLMTRLTHCVICARRLLGARPRVCARCITAALGQGRTTAG